MEIPLEAQSDIEVFKDWLKDQLTEPTAAQVDALWSAIDVSDTLGDYGIHGVRIDYPWGVEVRYGIQGLPGLWGWAAVQEVISSEK
jgi:hypothetical protein